MKRKATLISISNFLLISMIELLKKDLKQILVRKIKFTIDLELSITMSISKTQRACLKVKALSSTAVMVSLTLASFTSVKILKRWFGASEEKKIKPKELLKKLA